MFSTPRTAQQRPSQQPPLRPLLSLAQQKFPLFPSHKALCPRQPHQVLAQRPLELEKSSMEILLVLRLLYSGWLFWLLCKALKRQMSCMRDKIGNQGIFSFISSTFHTIHIPRPYDKQIYHPNTSPRPLLCYRFKRSGSFIHYLTKTSPLSTATSILISSLSISVVLASILQNFSILSLFVAQAFEYQSLFKAGQSLFQFEIDLEDHVVSCGCCGRRGKFFDFVWGWRNSIWFVQDLKIDLERSS